MVAGFGVEIIQCEKFAAKELRDAVRLVRAINPKIKILAAGGVNGDNAAEVAATGVDGLVTSWPFFGGPKDVKMVFKNLGSYPYELV